MISLGTSSDAIEETCFKFFYLNNCFVDSKLTYFGAVFEMECATFRPASTRLDHALVVACGLTQLGLLFIHISGCIQVLNTVDFLIFLCEDDIVNVTRYYATKLIQSINKINNKDTHL